GSCASTRARSSRSATSSQPTRQSSAARLEGVCSFVSREGQNGLLLFESRPTKLDSANIEDDLSPVPGRTAARRDLVGGRRRRMATTLVNASKHEGVMVLELNAPPANTYSYDMMRELDAHVLEARMDQGVPVLVVSGARHGGKAEFFCAGA